MEKVFKIAEKHLSGNDLEFFKRVWSSELNVYEKRLEAIQYKGLGHVLDAGFGMGQWLVKLSEMNRHVSGIEYSSERVKAVELILTDKNINNVEIIQGTIEALPYENNTFDAIFCYGVIFITDYRKVLREFYRVLKPGGKLYFTANDLGWYLFCLIEEHNKSENYNPRQMAIDTIKNTINYYSGIKIEDGGQIIIKRDMLNSELLNMGFNNILMNSEGHTNFFNPKNINSFYKHSDYKNEGYIFEVHATKKKS